MAFRYRESVLEALARNGVRPTGDTPPELVRAFVNDLYLIELRALKARQQAGEIAIGDYAAEVLALRQRYPVLSLPIQFWTVKGNEK